MGKQATALGWTARDLFGLQPVADKPAPNYRRLSRNDETGLIWLLQGRPVVVLTESTGAIENPTGAITGLSQEQQAGGRAVTPAERSPARHAGAN
jgi:hypothetical protein